jgi:hypothetical protein
MDPDAGQRLTNARLAERMRSGEREQYNSTGLASVTCS